MITGKCSCRSLTPIPRNVDERDVMSAQEITFRDIQLSNRQLNDQGVSLKKLVVQVHGLFDSKSLSTYNLAL